MATYKVIQDIEAEDKFVGPLTLKQFVFGMVGAGFAYLCFFSVAGGFPIALIVFVPPMLLGFFLAWPWSQDQPTEVWLLAKLRFKFKPRKRIWDQSGVEELVTITVPKKVEKHLTDNLSQTEVKSRLKALAQTIDSRGWAIKQADMFTAINQQADTTERLVSPTSLPTEVPIVDINNIPDEYASDNPLTVGLDTMLHQSEDLRKAQSLEKMNRIRNGEDIEAAELPTVHFTPPSVTTTSYTAPATDNEAALAEELRSRHQTSLVENSHMRTIQPLSPSSQTQTQNTDSSATPQPSTNISNTNDEESAVPPPPQAAILEYASNNDLNVATIARQAKKETEESADNNEVVVSLH